MKYVDEYRNGLALQDGIRRISDTVAATKKQLVLMEVCGTHTMAIFRSGLKSRLPSQIKIVSGPGCPVCVSPNRFIDKVVAYARKPGIIITTFGDMLRVPGSSSSLEKEKAAGADVRVVYSILDALTIAKINPQKKIIFLGVGFETTAPTVAATIKAARHQGIGNFFVFSAHKVIPPAMRALLESRDVHVDGFICPGHVSAIIGSRPYEFIAREYRKACVIAGFEPLDLVQAVYMLVDMIAVKKKASVKVQYKRVVDKEGNLRAQAMLKEVFETVDSNWRGLGAIPKSGLAIRKGFCAFDAEKNIPVKPERTRQNKQCRCADILCGVIVPPQCPLFRKVCTPENPVGACMVSSEGTCAAYYKYEA